MPDAPSAARHNAVLRQGERRAREMEEKFARILEPVLERAGDEAARAFSALAVDHLAAAARLRAADVRAAEKMGMREARRLLASMSLTAAVDVKANSTMVAVKPRPDEAAAIADPDGGPAENLHVTLCYLGEVDGDLRPVADALAAVAAEHAPLAGQVGGYGQFGMPDGSSVGILLPDVPGLVELRVAVTEALVDAGVGYSRDHGFEAHITVDGDPEPGELEKMLPLSGSPLHFDDLLVVRGDTEIVPVPLVGRPAATASLAAAGEERYCLPAQLRTRTDPVRQEVVRTMMRASLEGVGLSFDVTHPVAQRVLAQSASQIGHISLTTQLDVMRVIRAAHEEGLSIDDTAAAIRAKMREAAPARARLIARTELAGAVNGGSLAATRIVAEATGEAFFKTWMTARGAKYPRHATYAGLDGQTRALDGYFDVGGASLEHPGDPSGPPAEVCNCRCAMGYTQDPEAVTASAGGNHPCAAGHEDTQRVEAALVGIAASLTAAGPAGWSAPDPDEMLNVSCTTSAARTIDLPSATVIHPDDVADWTAGSAYGDTPTVFHQTNLAGARGIKTSGFDPSKSVNIRLGHGLYTTPQKARKDRYGSENLEIAVNARKVFKAEDDSKKLLNFLNRYDQKAWEMEDVFDRDGALKRARELMVKDGYDAIETTWQGNPSVVVILNPRAARVLDEKAPRAASADRDPLERLAVPEPTVRSAPESRAVPPPAADDLLPDYARTPVTDMSAEDARKELPRVLGHSTEVRAKRTRARRAKDDRAVKRATAEVDAAQDRIAALRRRIAQG
jgi:2'-5' RNA ligase